MILTQQQIDHWNQSRAERGLGPLDLSKPRTTRRVSSLPSDQWPLWARALKAIATPEDKGIGDVVRRTIGTETSEVFKAWFKKTTGKDCGCAGRQARWNQMYPLK